MFTKKSFASAGNCMVGAQASQMVLAFDPQKQKWDALSDRRTMIPAIRVGNSQINQIGRTRIHKKITLADGAD